MPRLHALAALLFAAPAVALAACSEEPAGLVVDLRTDYLPGVEFTSADVVLDDGVPIGVAAAEGLDFASGRRVAEYDDVPLGDHELVVSLLSADGSTVASRRTEFDVEGTYGVTVVITRDCAGVECPALGGDRTATECVGGRCITPLCHPGNLDACGAPDCAVSSDCESDQNVCLQGLCVGGACLRVARDNRCAEGETCDPDLGCMGQECVPAMETCDGVDDEDCDGMVDEGCECTIGQTQPCGSAVGACSPGTETCDDAGMWGACEGGVGPAMETCDGTVDESCDGTVDEGCMCSAGSSRPCGSDVGACAAGSQSCMGGTWAACAGATMPTAETCDGTADEDCDGMVDEGCDCTNGMTRPCGMDVGACTAGTETCMSGAWGGCVGARGPMTERCNGIDDDCDGLVDSAAACPACAFVRMGDEPYLFCDTPMPFDNARTVCQSYGYDMVALETAGENSWVYTQANIVDNAEWWIGLQRNGAGAFVWVVDGSTPTFTNWESSSSYDCANFSRYDDRWRSKRCNDSRPFICELPP